MSAKADNNTESKVDSKSDVKSEEDLKNTDDLDVEADVETDSKDEKSTTKKPQKNKDPNIRHCKQCDKDLPKDDFYGRTRTCKKCLESTVLKVTKRSKLNDPEVAMSVARSILEGKNLTEISKQLDIPTSTISHWNRTGKLSPYLEAAVKEFKQTKVTFESKTAKK